MRSWQHIRRPTGGKDHSLSRESHRSLGQALGLTIVIWCKHYIEGSGLSCEDLGYPPGPRGCDHFADFLIVAFDTSRGIPIFNTGVPLPTWYNGKPDYVCSECEKILYDFNTFTRFIARRQYCHLWMRLSMGKFYTPGHTQMDCKWKRSKLVGQYGQYDFFTCYSRSVSKMAGSG